MRYVLRRKMKSRLLNGPPPNIGRSSRAKTSSLNASLIDARVGKCSRPPIFQEIVCAKISPRYVAQKRAEPIAWAISQEQHPAGRDSRSELREQFCLRGGIEIMERVEEDDVAAEFRQLAGRVLFQKRQPV